MEGNYQTDIEYDALNRVTKMKYPEDTDQERKELTPAYNRSGALESVVFDGTTYVDHIAYNARGQRLMITLGNDIMTRYAYDNKTFRLARICSERYQKTGWLYSPDGGVKQDTAYNYDLAGNIISTNDESPNSGVGLSGALEREFSYDPLYRLLSATGRENAPTISPIWDDSYRSDDHTQTTPYTQKYNYDKMGNILRLKHTGNSDFTRVFNPDSGNMPDDYGNQNLLNEVKIGSTNYSFQYDANGNLIQENADRFYEWDAADQMRCFFIDDGSTITKHAHYLYDAAGNRVKKLVRVDGGNYTSNTYIDGVFERKTDGTDEQNSLHIMDDTSRIALLRLGEAMGDSTPPVKYILEDHLGSSVLELKDDGQNIFREEYYPYGETSFGSHAFKRYKYSGKERDNESGLYYCKFRYHSAWTCRFISVDPLSSKYPHNSSYAYAENSVVTHTEFEGLEKINPNDLGLRVRSRPFPGRVGQNHNFTEYLTAQSAARLGGFLGEGSKQQKFFYVTQAMKHGTYGHYMWEMPTFRTDTENNLLGFSADSNPPQMDRVINRLNLTFDRGLHTGLDVDQIAAISSIIPAIGEQPFVPNGPEIVIDSITNELIVDNLPITVETTTFSTPGSVTTNLPPTVNVLIQTNFLNADARGGEGQTAGQVMNQRSNNIQNALIEAGVNRGNIIINFQYNAGLATPNQVTITVQINSTNQTGTNDRQSTTTSGLQYSE